MLFYGFGAEVAKHSYSFLEKAELDLALLGKICGRLCNLIFAFIKKKGGNKP